MNTTALAETRSLSERIMGPIAMIGGLIVAIGVALIAAEYWSNWSSSMRVFSTLGVALIFLALSVVPLVAQKTSISGALAVIGSPLLPIGAFVTLRELGFTSGEAGPYWVLFISGLTLSLISLWQKRGTYAFFGFPVMLAGVVCLARFYLFGREGVDLFGSAEVPKYYEELESLVFGSLFIFGAWWAAMNAKRLLVELWSLAGLWMILAVPLYRWFNTSHTVSMSYFWLTLSIVATALAFVVAGKLRSWLGLILSACATIALAVGISYKHFSDHVGIAVVVAGVLIILFGSGAVFTWRRWFKRDQ